MSAPPARPGQGPLESEGPDLVLLGQQSDDGECYTIGAVVADHLKMPSLTRVIDMKVDGDKIRCERQAVRLRHRGPDPASRDLGW